MNNPAWYDRLVDLLTTGIGADGVATGGAQLKVIDPAGNLLYRQPIARHARLEPDDNTVLWIRQIVGGGPDFDLNECRRRSLPADAVHIDDDGDFHFEIPEGTATITDADPDQLAVLTAWDSFVIGGLSADDEASLPLLEEDSWQ